MNALKRFLRYIARWRKTGLSAGLATYAFEEGRHLDQSIEQYFKLVWHDIRILRGWTA